MFYTPKHCCECGEKIERSKWKPLTVRRFCEICESDFSIHDWMLRGVVGIGILFTAFGIGSFLKKTEKPLNITTTSHVSAASNRVQNAQTLQSAGNTGVQSSSPKQDAENRAVQSDNQSPVAAASLKTMPAKQAPPLKGQPTVSEAVYFCGAQTKKGTPCTRRVKVAGRCWQHAGQTAY